MVLEGRQQEHKVMTNIYYIPKLKNNVVSLGQLEENGCKVVLENGFLCVLDQERKLLVKAPRTDNRLYTVKLGILT